MEHYFNQGLLYAFIYRHYPFYNMAQGLVQNGKFIVEIILKNLIENDQSLWNLKNNSIQDVNKLVSQQFAYKVGGLEFFYGAFANYYQSLFPTHQNTGSFLQIQSISQKMHEEFIQHVLQNQEIKHVYYPFKDRLEQISYLQKITNHLPSINERQIQMKKIDFLSNFIDFQQPQPKKNKKKSKKKDLKQKSQSLILRQPKNFQYSCGKMQEQINTQVDEFQSHTFSEQYNLVIQKDKFQFNPKRSNFKQLTNVFENTKIEDQAKTMNFQPQNKLLLRYDQLLPEKYKLRNKRELKLSRF